MATAKNSWKISRGTVSQKEGAVKMFGITATLVVGGTEVLDVNDISVIEGTKGTYVALPQRSYTVNGEKKYANEVYVKDEDLRKSLEKAVLEYFDEQ